MSNSLRDYLELEPTWAYGIKSQTEAVKKLRDAIEQKGISVAINGIVGDNTHRPLKVEEFRGFVLSDAIAPIIFVNGQDAKSAQLFTMIHELAHLALAKTGIINPVSDNENNNTTPNATERFCDMIAAEFLVNSQQLYAIWSDTLAKCATLFDAVKYIAKLHKVSFMVVARQARQLLLINNEEFFSLYQRYKKEIAKIQPKKQQGGGNIYYVKAYRLGTVFSEAVWAALNSNAITLNDAYDLCGLSTKTFSNYFSELHK